MMHNPFRHGSAPAIFWSLARLLFWAVVACLRLTFRAIKHVVIFVIGFWIGFEAVRRYHRDAS